ncbi:MAG: ParB/Srx family N-terminal domain-containing protein [Novosphingobium sp.]|nr:ParB/Srx family N-terminal domain-containing protein [Novosphingobium sp.]
MRPDPGNARKHSQRQLVRLKAVVAEFGFTNPILIDENCKVIAGHARLQVAQMLGMKTVPCLQLDHLSAGQKTALALADNKIGDMSDFDPQALATQLAQLCAIDFNIELTGFETAEADTLTAAWLRREDLPLNWEQQWEALAG